MDRNKPSIENLNSKGL